VMFQITHAMQNKWSWCTIYFGISPLAVSGWQDPNMPLPK